MWDLTCKYNNCLSRQLFSPRFNLKVKQHHSQYWQDQPEPMRCEARGISPRGNMPMAEAWQRGPTRYTRCPEVGGMCQWKRVSDTSLCFSSKPQKKLWFLGAHLKNLVKIIVKFVIYLLIQRYCHITIGLSKLPDYKWMGCSKVGIASLTWDDACCITTSL